MNQRIVIVGAGITGLAAGHEAQRHGHEVVVLDRAERAGGKIATETVEGTHLPFPVDLAADGFLARRPEVVGLVEELGLAGELVAPRTSRAFLWVDGQLRAIPSPSVLGVPLEPDAVAGSGLVSEAGVAELRAGLTRDAAPLLGDASVGEVLRPRLGDEVFERLVDPLLGGINAGNADQLSIVAGAPQLAAAAATGGRFDEALRRQATEAQAAAAGPVFNGIRGGNGRLIEALAATLGPNLRLGHEVTGLQRSAEGWTVATARGPFTADRVVLATPAPVTARLIEPYCPTAAHTLTELGYGDAVLVTFVVEREGITHDLDGSGFLVPRDQGLLMTACSWTSSKWEHYDDGVHAVLRVSAGRTDDQRWLTLAPDELVAALTEELRVTVGLTGQPITRVSPWRQSLPQYRPGHFERCDAIDAELAERAPGITASGAQMRGLGLPACVGQGRSAISG